MVRSAPVLRATGRPSAVPAQTAVTRPSWIFRCSSRTAPVWRSRTTTSPSTVPRIVIAPPVAAALTRAVAIHSGCHRSGSASGSAPRALHIGEFVPRPVRADDMQGAAGGDLAVAEHVHHQHIPGPGAVHRGPYGGAQFRRGQGAVEDGARVLEAAEGRGKPGDALRHPLERRPPTQHGVLARVRRDERRPDQDGRADHDGSLSAAADPIGRRSDPGRGTSVRLVDRPGADPSALVNEPPRSREKSGLTTAELQTHQIYALESR